MAHQISSFVFSKQYSNVEKEINDFLQKLEADDRIVIRYLANLDRNESDLILTIDLIHRPVTAKDKKNLDKGPQRFKTFNQPIYENGDIKEINQWFEDMEAPENEFNLSKSIRCVADPEKQMFFFYRVKKKEEEKPAAAE